MAKVIPVGVGIANPKVCRQGRRRGVCTGEGAVCARHNETHGSRQSKEQTHARLVDAPAYACANEAGNATPWRQVGAATPRLSYSGERRARSMSRRAKIPNRELLELATGEGTKGLFVGSVE
jgi:hypothetical protein